MLSVSAKRVILKEILNTDFLGKYSAHDGILTFLLRVWDLRSMPSEDSRFTNAYDDIRQHIINNDDWTNEELFESRLNIINGEERYFVAFLETVVNPTVRNSKEEIISYVSRINVHLEKSGIKLVLSDYFEGLPLFKVKFGDDAIDLPIDIAENKVPIYLSDYDKKEVYPHIFLEYDKWDDFGCVTQVYLTVALSQGNSKYIGAVKILKQGIVKTWDHLPKYFTSLGQEFCSLGQSKSYYENLKGVFGSNFSSFMLAMRDAAIFPKISGQFENDPVYTTSLLRDNEVERLVRTIRFEIEGINPNEYFKFNYNNKPPYSENEINLNFDFEYYKVFEHRVYALIGKNGTGKTRILSSLAKNLGDKQSNHFTPRKPVYGKVFTVSYSFFDKFEIPASDASFNYVYCGLKKPDGTWKTEPDLLEGFYQSANKIRQKSLQYDWIEILKKFLPNEIIESLRFKEITDDGKTFYPFDVDLFEKTKSKLSSGQSIILFIISEILSHIRYDSLILYDEPETHLHPNAISALVNTLFELVKRFQSFCIIATHSPLIIQEIPSRNIFIIEREEKSSRVRQLEWESLGENLTVITQDIFGNSQVPKHYMTTIQYLIHLQKNYDEIIKIMESDNLPVTSNIRLYVKTLLKKA